MLHTESETAAQVPCLPEALKTIVAWALAGILRTPPTANGYSSFREQTCEVILRWQLEAPGRSTFHLVVKFPFVGFLKPEDRRIAIEAELPSLAEAINTYYRVVPETLQYTCSRYAADLMWAAEVSVNEG